MRDDIISYDEIVKRERTRPQKGMNFRVSKKHSIVLMSLREDRPYVDEIDEETGLLLYEGHNAARNNCENPKTADQPMFLPSGKLTENGKFLKTV